MVLCIAVAPPEVAAFLPAAVVRWSSGTVLHGEPCLQLIVRQRAKFPCRAEVMPPYPMMPANEARRQESVSCRPCRLHDTQVAEISWPRWAALRR
jgi:hypothetical protein